MTRLTDNTSRVINDIETKSSIFLRVVSDEMIKISTPKTPKKTGRMRMDVNKQVLGLKGKVKWGKNYAIYQETKQFKNYSTPGTGPHFAEDSANQVVTMTNEIARRVNLV